MIHDQWTYRNDIVHKRDKDGLNKSEASALRVNIRGQLSLGTQSLNPEDHFLVEYDHDTITSWPVAKRKEWLTAIRAARNIRTTRPIHRTKTSRRSRQQQDNPPSSTPPASVPVPIIQNESTCQSPAQPPQLKPPPRRSNRKRRGTSRASHPAKKPRRTTKNNNSPLLEATHRQGMVGRGKRKRTHQFSSWKTSRKKL